MLNNFCILSDDWESLLHEPNYTKNIFPVFLINGKTAPLAQLFKLIYTSSKLNLGNTQFSVCFDFTDLTVANNNALSQLLADDFICNLVFHPAYYVHHNSPYIFYLGLEKDAAQFTKYLRTISRQLLSQSYNEVHFEELNKTTSEINEDNFCIFNENDLQSNISTLYFKALQKGHYNKYIVVKNDIAFINELKEQVLETEKIFSDQYPLQYEQMQLLAKTSKENELLKWKQKNFVAQIDNYKTYLDLIISADEANTINQFYHHEYEILPLWFKRIGHLIKVVTGKRSFRSLYSKNVNKYKK